MDENNFLIPRTLDDPPLFLFWEIDTALVTLGTFIFLLFINFLLACVLTFYFTKFYLRLKDEGGSGLFVRIAYWFTPSDWWLGDRYPSSAREYLG